MLLIRCAGVEGVCDGALRSGLSERRRGEGVLRDRKILQGLGGGGCVWHGIGRSAKWGCIVCVPPVLAALRDVLFPSAYLSA